MKNKNTIRKIESLIELVIMTLVFYWIWKNIIIDSEYYFPFLGRGKYILMGIYFVLNLVIIHLCEGFKYGFLRISDVLFSQWIAIFIVDFITYFQLGLMANTMVPAGPLLLLTLANFAVSLVCVFIFFLLLFCFVFISILKLDLV